MSATGDLELAARFLKSAHTSLRNARYLGVRGQTMRDEAGALMEQAHKLREAVLLFQSRAADQAAQDRAAGVRP